MEKQLFGLVAAMAVLVLLAAAEAPDGAAPAAPALLCGMTEKGLEACQPAVKPAGAGAAPSAACCKALAGADLSCLCKFKNDNANLLKSLNIDPKLATLLPANTMIQNMIKEGKIVPSEVTVKLLQRAMKESGNNKFLIDGFPRNEENRAAFEEVTKIVPEFVLFFDCPEEEMERRLLNRNQGRVDDNVETIRKRFKVFMESSIPVVEHYDSKGKVHKVNAAKPVEEVFETVKDIFSPFGANVV